jgi:two-component system sensor histidine kinase DesK
VDGRGDRARVALDALGAALLTRRRIRRWSELTRVERVALYTRQSLYIMLWGFSASTLLAAAVDPDNDEPAGALVAGGLVVTFAAFMAFVPMLRSVERLPWRRLVPLFAAGAGYIALAVAAWSDVARGAALLVATVALVVVLATLHGRAIVVALVLGSGLLFGLVGGEPEGFAIGALIATFFIFTVRASLWLLGIVKDLDEASHVKAQLAVVEERLRFSRDVHDVLGRRLSTIAVQAELAATLAARGDERAAERMLDVRGVAHEALREARELARGYRATDFLNELDGAGSLLRSAGIEVRVQVDAMPRAWHEAAGWIVRESVTNVLRHSNATVVGISYADGRLQVDNDGAGAEASPGGSGLRGLRERLVPLGASLGAGLDGDGRWVVVAQLPGSGPLSANHKEGLPS